MLGRYSASARLIGWGPMPLGAAIAGAVGQFAGLRAAFALAALAVALMVVPFLRNVTADALAEVEPGPGEVRRTA